MYSLRLSTAAIHALSLNSCDRQLLPLNMRALITSCTIDRPKELLGDEFLWQLHPTCRRSPSPILDGGLEVLVELGQGLLKDLLGSGDAILT